MTDGPLAPPADLALVICTYRRPEPLKLALASALRQRVPEGARFAIVVVDNSDEGSAEAVVAAHAGGDVPVIYAQAHPPNISVARNAGLAAAAASPLIAFIDDDQEMTDGWLDAMLDGARRHPQDVFVGPMVGLFEAPDKATPAMRSLFSRDTEAPDGTELFAMGPRKTADVILSTANSLFRRDALEGLRFDPAFGHAGGEDYDLFCRLQAAGRRIGWLAGPRVTEHVPASRCDAAYMRRRVYAGGQAYAAAVSKASERPRATRWRLRALAAVQTALLAAQAPVMLLRGRDAFADHTVRMAGVLGKLSLGGMYPVYREADAGA